MSHAGRYSFLISFISFIPMHVLEIPSFFPPYGGLFCLDQAKALAALGHEVRILSNVQLGMTIGLKDYLTLPFSRYEREMDGIRVFQSYQRGIPKCVRYNVRRWVGVVQSMFADYVRKYGQPDILHAHCGKWAGYAAMQISHQHHIPYVITEHLSKQLFRDEFGDDLSNVWQIPLLTEAYRQASMVVPVSEELVDSLASYFGTDYRWQPLSNVIDVDFYHYQKRMPLEGRPFRFCCLASFWPLKGYDVLIPAFRQLRESGVVAELHIAGRGTDSADCLSMLSDGIVSHGLLDKETVRSLLYQSDALVLASRSEVQPLVLLEAMSTGIPVVATECIPQSLRIEQGCTIVPVDDVKSLSEAMRKVSQCDSFDGQTVSGKVRQMAAPEIIGQKLVAMFSDILASD